VLVRGPTAGCGSTAPDVTRCQGELLEVLADEH
jgi:hypothetical protein